jgi:hypothetical protein
VSPRSLHCKLGQSFSTDIFFAALVFDDFWNSASTPSTSPLGNDHSSFAEFVNGITANPATGYDPQIVDDENPMEPSPSSDPPNVSHHSFQQDNKGGSLNILHTNVEVQNSKHFKLSEAQHLLIVSLHRTSWSLVLIYHSRALNWGGSSCRLSSGTPHRLYIHLGLLKTSSHPLAGRMSDPHHGQRYKRPHATDLSPLFCHCTITIT